MPCPRDFGQNFEMHALGPWLFGTTPQIREPPAEECRVQKHAVLNVQVHVKVCQRQKNHVINAFRRSFCDKAATGFSGRSSASGFVRLRRSFFRRSHKPNRPSAPISAVSNSSMNCSLNHLLQNCMVLSANFTCDHFPSSNGESVLPLGLCFMLRQSHREMSRSSQRSASELGC